MSSETLQSKLRWTAALTFVAVFGCVGGIIAWGATAPLAGAAIARGAFAPETSRKTIQHLEGGIVRAILVKEGDEVKQGQALFVLESTAAKSTFEAQQGSVIRLETTKARLDALLILGGKFNVAEQLSRAPGNVPFAAFVAHQSDLFETLKRAEIAKRDILERQIAQLEQDIVSSTAQFQALKRQIPLIMIQLTDQRSLFEKGLARKPLVLDLERQMEKAEGDQQALAASIEKSREQINEKRLMLTHTVMQFERQMTDELVKTNTDLADALARIQSSQDIVGRSIIAAPEAGTVLNLRIKTIGGVVAPGSPLIDLVPQSDELIVTARIMPNDIAYVHPGATTRILFLAYPQRGMPMVPGIVNTVSADLITDPNARVTGTEAYYEAKIMIDRKVLKELAPWVEIVPGMPVEAYIETKPRVALDYLLEPFSRSFGRSFREL